ncbi:rhamnulokinase [Microlunatus speluncae]|uniref:rhamnulokinase n=1 Tax=Microlunatus speluncae TaxID=2594267 RepID=UPI001266394E|nr:rhamnulokinase family protein [Microlunatus speluncae]
MGNQAVFGAVDIGASGGRVMAGWIADGRIELELVHRFGNQMDQRDGRLYWDFGRLCSDVIDGLTRLAARFDHVISIGIDTWAVDYGLLDRTGELIGDPVAYRDDRTAAVIGDVHAKIDFAELYAIAGLQFLPFNTIYQVAAEQREDRWSRAETLLMLPDLLAYGLTGQRQTEATNASTTGLFDATAREWSPVIMDRLGVPASLLPPVRPSGTVIGKLLPDLARKTGLPATTVITSVGSHDTASAIVGTPLESPAAAYISSGTWSLVGVELDQPILSAESRLANFTNEGGVDGTVRYLRNAGGLWLLSECVRSWESDGQPVDLDRLLAEAAAVTGPVGIIDADAEEFIAPDHMPERIAVACERTGQPVPRTRAEFTRTICESLAAAYASIVRTAGELSGRTIDSVHVVGGGSQNELLCRLTADRCGLPVIAGPTEATAIGNVLVQARAHGALSGTLADLRQVVRASTNPRRYTPS